MGNIFLQLSRNIFATVQQCVSSVVSKTCNATMWRDLTKMMPVLPDLKTELPFTWRVRKSTETAQHVACVAGVRRGGKGERRAREALDGRRHRSSVPPRSMHDPPAFILTLSLVYGLHATQATYCVEFNCRSNIVVSFWKWVWRVRGTTRGITRICPGTFWPSELGV